LSTEASLFLAHLGIEYRVVQEYLKDDKWFFPAATRRQSLGLHRIFDHFRNPDDEVPRIRASCAELLGLYGLLRHFIEVNGDITPENAAPWASFEALCHCIDLILAAKRRVATPEAVGPQLKAAHVRHLVLHMEAYGTRGVKPKHHWQLDTASQLARDKCVLDAFVIERIHLQVKAAATCKVWVFSDIRFDFFVSGRPLLILLCAVPRCDENLAPCIVAQRQLRIK
jgi:hypothetical protein